MTDNILQDFSNRVAEMSTERVSAHEGFEVESWYNEGRCNWEAWIKGVGSRTSPHNREDAIASVVEMAKGQ